MTKIYTYENEFDPKKTTGWYHDDETLATQRPKNPKHTHTRFIARGRRRRSKRRKPGYPSYVLPPTTQPNPATPPMMMIMI
jgi:hypothetical protein